MTLQQQGRTLETVIPAWTSVTGPSHVVTIAPDPAGHEALAALPRRPNLWIMVQNALLGAWDGQGAAALIADPAASASVLDQLEQQAITEKASGLLIDFEDLPPAAQPDLRRFLRQARERCRGHGWILAVTAPVADPAWDLPAIAQAADRIVLMAYDEHWQSGPAGPIASKAWFGAVAAKAMAGIPSSKAIIAVASYAYDWPTGQSAKVLSIEQAEALAAQAGVRPDVDPAGADDHFAYSVDGVQHDVWMMTADITSAEVGLARSLGARNVALWRLGTEDPLFWRGSLDTR
jgi:spore germination protein YaaH